MPSDRIALVNSQRDCLLVRNYYADSSGVRLNLKNARLLATELPSGLKLWLDGGVDALHRQEKMTDGWKEHLESFEQGDHLLEHGLSGQCERARIAAFVSDVLTKCGEYSPDWISVPQVPVGPGTDRNRNKLNKELARAAENWRRENSYVGKLMLPVVLLDKDVLNTKTSSRTKKLDEIKSKVDTCPVNGIWVVNTDLDDEQGSVPNEQKRLPGLIEFHRELREEIEEDIRIVAGPYWAMNIVLWAREFVENPVIGVATGYRYYIPGAPVRPPKDRVAIAPLRRRAVALPKLRDWLQEAAKTLQRHAASATGVSGINDWFTQAAAEFRRASNEISSLARQYGTFRGEFAHDQVARFYKDWLNGIEKAPKNMRALSLHQDLSSAHVIGTIVGNLPEGIRPRQSGRLARQYMLNCL
ncbi:hypothetical protein KAX17_08320 [Candidatus Bipolaricaulota bacterium]|nr:hypothetical protein [Candidatus Bipolaricaulota bacterium]